MRLVLERAVQRDNIRMVDFRQRLCLAENPLRLDVRTNIPLQQHLQRQREPVASTADRNTVP